MNIPHNGLDATMCHINKVKITTCTLSKPPFQPKQVNNDERIIALIGNSLQAIPASWFRHIAAARPQAEVVSSMPEQSVIVIERLEQTMPPQHELTI